jgi:hypothetical protein
MSYSTIVLLSLTARDYDIRTSSFLLLGYCTRTAKPNLNDGANEYRNQRREALDQMRPKARAPLQSWMPRIPRHDIPHTQQVTSLPRARTSRLHTAFLNLEIHCIGTSSMVSSLALGKRTRIVGVWSGIVRPHASHLGPIDELRSSASATIYAAQIRTDESPDNMSWYVAEPQPSNCRNMLRPHIMKSVLAEFLR